MKCHFPVADLEDGLLQERLRNKVQPDVGRLGMLTSLLQVGLPVAGQLPFEDFTQDNRKGIRVRQSLCGQPLGLDRAFQTGRGARRLPCSRGDPRQQQGQHRRRRAQCHFVTAGDLPENVDGARSGCLNWFVGKVAPDVRGKGARGFVAAGTVFLYRLHHDPVQLTFESAGGDG